MLGDLNPIVFFVTFAVLVLSIGVHEFAHVLSAYLQGDQTGKMLGRLTLNPIRHLDPFGTIFMVMAMLSGIGIGWGKPAPFNPYSLRYRRWGPALVAIAGPISNIVVVAISGYAFLLLYPTLGANNLLSLFLATLALINAALAVFNLLPIHPLDGSHILSGILGPEHPLVRFFDRYGFFILLGMIFLAGGFLSYYVLTGIDLIFRGLGLGGGIPDILDALRAGGG